MTSLWYGPNERVLVLALTSYVSLISLLLHYMSRSLMPVLVSIFQVNKSPWKHQRDPGSEEHILLNTQTHTRTHARAHTHTLNRKTKIAPSPPPPTMTMQPSVGRSISLSSCSQIQKSAFLWLVLVCMQHVWVLAFDSPTQRNGFHWIKMITEGFLLSHHI